MNQWQFGKLIFYVIIVKVFLVERQGSGVGSNVGALCYLHARSDTSAPLCTPSTEGEMTI